MDERENAIAELKRKLSFIKDTEIPPFVKRKEALQKLCTQLENQQTALKNVKRNLSPEDCQKLVTVQQTFEIFLMIFCFWVSYSDTVVIRIHLHNTPNSSTIVSTKTFSFKEHII